MNHSTAVHPDQQPGADQGAPILFRLASLDIGWVHRDALYETFLYFMATPRRLEAVLAGPGRLLLQPGLAIEMNLSLD